MWDKIKKIFGFGPKFKVGDIVRCIDDRGWNSSKNTIPLIYGKTYKILDITYSKCCNIYSIDFGCRLNDNTHTVCKCSKNMVGMGIHWAYQYRFVKDNVLAKEELNEELEEALSEEDYERAAVIRDKMKLLVK
jgi:protein-arginine kinase activator protein McsA